MANIVGTSAAETLGNNAGVSDTITGLAGHDTFVYTRSGAAETDVMTDFGSTYFAASLTGGQENPPVATTASGSLVGALSRGDAHFTFDISLTNLDLGGQTGTTADNVTAAHFHNAPAGSNGGIVFGFIGTPNNDTDGDTSTNAPAGTVHGQWDTAEGNAGTTLTAQLANLLAGNLYVNFHTVGHSSGEIRGQVIAQDSGLDQLDVTAANIGEFSTMQFLLHDVGGSAEFTTTFNGNDHTMQFSGVSEADLSAADFIFAGSVNETIVGTGNADDLFGAGGKDKIKAANGADRLFGESGNDMLTGGGLKDTLYGGTGGDSFIYAKLGDSKVAAAKRDIIDDFNHAAGDKISLVKLDADSGTGGDQAFFLGGAAFTGAAGELIQFAGGSGTILQGDTDGDSDADFAIELTGAVVLVNGDFVF